MKKLASLILALLLVAAFSVGALAEDVAAQAVELAVGESEAALPGAGEPAAEYADFVGEQAVSDVEYYDGGVYAYGEGLTSLDSLNLPADLLQLGCSDNALTGLDMGKYTQLEALWCEANKLTSLNVTKNAMLEQLFCADNRLAKLDVSKNPALRYFSCANNQLTALDVSKNKGLEELYASGNAIKVLDLTNNRYLALAAGTKPKNNDGVLHFEYSEEDEEGDERTYILEIDPNTTIKASGKTLYGQADEKTSIADAKVTAKAQVYTGKAMKPAVTVKLGGKKLVKGTDYTIAYSHNKAVGEATITVKGVGSYTGSVVGTFNISPKKVAGLTLASGSKRLTVSWKKGAGITGYELQYGLKKDFSDARTVTIKKATTVKKTITKLKGGRTYYVRVRAYKNSKGLKFRSAWTKAKKMKTGK